MYARVSKVMAQFVLKIEKLSHIMGPTPILEMARAYGLRPRLWLLSQLIPYQGKTIANGGPNLNVSETSKKDFSLSKSILLAEVNWVVYRIR